MAALLPFLQICSQTLASVMEELMAINDEKQVGALILAEKNNQEVAKF